MKARQKLLTTNEVGERLGFKSRTVSRWCREGKIVAYKYGRVWRIPESSLLMMGQAAQEEGA
jgi:putative resolvase